jgi:hypothetical protein
MVFQNKISKVYLTRLHCAFLLQLCFFVLKLHYTESDDYMLRYTIGLKPVSKNVFENGLKNKENWKFMKMDKKYERVCCVPERAKLLKKVHMIELYEEGSL